MLLPSIAVIVLLLFILLLPGVKHRADLASLRREHDAAIRDLEVKLIYLRQKLLSSEAMETKYKCL